MDTEVCLFVTIGYLVALLQLIVALLLAEAANGAYNRRLY